MRRAHRLGSPNRIAAGGRVLGVHARQRRAGEVRVLAVPVEDAEADLARRPGGDQLAGLAVVEAVLREVLEVPVGVGGVVLEAADLGGRGDLVVLLGSKSPFPFGVLEDRLVRVAVGADRLGVLADRAVSVAAGPAAGGGVGGVELQRPVARVPDHVGDAQVPSSRRVGDLQVQADGPAAHRAEIGQETRRASPLLPSRRAQRRQRGGGRHSRCEPDANSSACVHASSPCAPSYQCGLIPPRSRVRWPPLRPVPTLG